MTHNPQSPSPLFTQVDITAAAPVSPPRGGQAADEQVGLLRNILSAQDRQNELLEELVTQLVSAQRQRVAELGQWKQANPDLAGLAARRPNRSAGFKSSSCIRSRARSTRTSTA